MTRSQAQTNPGVTWGLDRLHGLRQERRGTQSPEAAARDTAVAKLRQEQRRLDPGQVRELVAVYVGGSTVPELEHRYGVHRTTVLAHLNRAGIPRRPQQRKLSDDQLREAAALYARGLSTVAVGRHFGVAAETVRKALHRGGVSVRPRRGRRSS